MGRISKKKEQEICADLRTSMTILAIRKKHGISGREMTRIQEENGLLRGEKREVVQQRKIKRELESGFTEEELFYKTFPAKWEAVTKPFKPLLQEHEKRNKEREERHRKQARMFWDDV